MGRYCDREWYRIRLQDTREDRIIGIWVTYTFR